MITKRKPSDKAISLARDEVFNKVVGVSTSYHNLESASEAYYEAKNAHSRAVKVYSGLVAQRHESEVNQLRAAIKEQHNQIKRLEDQLAANQGKRRPK